MREINDIGVKWCLLLVTDIMNWISCVIEYLMENGYVRGRRLSVTESGNELIYSLIMIIIWFKGSNIEKQIRFLAAA